MYRLCGRVVLAAAMVAAFSTSAGVAVTAQPSRETITVRAARVLDGKGGTLQNATVEITDGKIVRVDQRTGPVTYRPRRRDAAAGADRHARPHRLALRQGRATRRTAARRRRRGRSPRPGTRGRRCAPASRRCRASVSRATRSCATRSTAARSRAAHPHVARLADRALRRPTRCARTSASRRQAGADLIKIFASKSIREAARRR